MLRYLSLVLILSAAPKAASQTLDWSKILIAEMQKDNVLYEECQRRSRKLIAVKHDLVLPEFDRNQGASSTEMAKELRPRSQM